MIKGVTRTPTSGGVLVPTNSQVGVEAPAQKVEICPGLPSLGRSLAGEQYFVVCKPGGRTQLLPDGTSPSAIFWLIGGLGGLIVSLLLGIWWVGAAGGPGSTVVAVGCALRIGFGSCGVLAEEIEKVERARGRVRTDFVERVDKTNPLGLALCDTMFRLGSTKAWQERVVDPPRRCSDLHWTALQRSLTLSEREADIARSRKHAALADLVRDASAIVERERSALGEVAANLTEVLRAAQRVDSSRAAYERRRVSRQQNEAEERELRARLIGTSVSAAPVEAEVSADASAGIAAESAAIADLVSTMDSILKN